MSVIPPSTVEGPYASHDYRSARGEGIAGFVVALCSLLLAFIPIIGLTCGIVGLSLSVVGLRKFDRLGVQNGSRGLAIAGLPIGIIGVLLGIFVTGFGAMQFLGGQTMWTYGK